MAEPTVLRNRGEYWYARTARKRHRCEGERSTCDFIEQGARYIEMKLPPGSDVGNVDWWRIKVCIACAVTFNRELVEQLGLAEAVSPR